MKQFFSEGLLKGQGQKATQPNPLNPETPEP